MLLLLPGEGAEDMPVLGVTHAGLILGKAAHLPAVASPQYDLRGIIGNIGCRYDGFAAGDQGVNAFQTGNMGLLLLTQLSGDGCLGWRQPPGKPLIRILCIIIYSFF